MNTSTEKSKKYVYPDPKNGTFRRPTIDSVKLIREVQKRPCLYDHRGTHGNHELKNAAWGEIAGILFEGKWKEFTLQEKDTLVKDLQVRWKNLRDNFSRHLRIREQAKAGIGTLPAKKYVYMDLLSFVAPYVNKSNYYRGALATEESRDSNDSSMFEDQNIFDSPSVEEDAKDTSISQMHFVPIQPKPTYTTATLNSFDLNSITVNPDEPPAKRIALCLEELTAVHKEDRAEDTMGNKRFLLSLLPFMKKLPDDVNLEVRLQLMSVLQTYSGGKGSQG